MHKASDNHLEFRRKVLWRLAAATGLFALTGTAIRALAGPLRAEPMVATLLAGVILLALGFEVRRKKERVILGSHVFLLVLGLTVVVVALLGQGFLTHLLMLLLLVPVFASFLLGKRGGILYTAIAMALILFIFFSQRSRDSSAVIMNLETTLLTRLIVFLIIIPMAAVVAFVYEHGRIQSEEKLLELNQALISEKRRAEEALAIKTRFLANMSHEIRTPMNGILGIASLLKDEVHDPVLASRIGMIEESGLYLAKIIDDILDFSKLEAGRLVLESIPVILRDLVQAVTDLTKPMANQKGMTVTVEVDPELPQRILGDPVRLQQIILNLVSNAIKFSEGKNVSLRLKKVANSVGIFWEVAVQDFGLGISKSDLSRLFQPFSQLDSSTTRKFGGTGLGLAISRNFVTLMKGEMDVTSEVGRGSTFVVRLPLKECSSPSPSSFPAPQRAPVFAFKILVVEDNRLNRIVIEGLLRKLGYAPDFAEDGEEALPKVEAGGYDIIFMDCQMPRMDGFAATRAIHALQLSRPPCIIALSASAMAEEQQKCIEAGMRYFVAKPIRVDVLEKLLSMVASERGQTPDPGSRGSIAS